MVRLGFIAAALASAIALCEGSSKMVIGYFPNWLYANYPVENIPYKKYTHINYAFAILNNEDNVPSFPDDWAVEAYLPKVVQLAHDQKTKVLLSVGGWTGSKRFSPMVASKESRKKFIDWNLNFIDKYKTDGVDLDWEYPGKQAAGCNEVADNDAENFLLLLKELRAALDKKYPKDRKEISMAVHVQPFINAGVPMTDLKAYVPYFDHVNLMTYDINGAWASTTGPNAPFKSRADVGAPFSFVDSIKEWKAAGVPANKITAGLAFYGRSMKAQGNMLLSRNQFQETVAGGAPKGDSDDAFWSDPYCNKEPGGTSGIWKWTNLRKEGLLKDDFVTAGEGWERNWDEVSQTPWLFNKESKHFISYDDPQSLNIKVEHALCEDLAGVMVWDIHQDNGELLDVVNKIHNPPPASCAKNLGDHTAVAEKVQNDVIKDDTSEEAEAPTEDTEEKDAAEEPPVKENPAPKSDAKAAPQDAPKDASTDVSKDAPKDAPEDEDTDYVEEPEMETEDTEVSSKPESAMDSELTPTASVDLTNTSDVASSSPVTGGSEDLNGKPCTVNGQQKCSNPGKDGKWLTCDNSAWLVRDCAQDLVCYDGVGGLYCGFKDASYNAQSVEKEKDSSSSPSGEEEIDASSSPSVEKESDTPSSPSDEKDASSSPSVDDSASPVPEKVNDVASSSLPEVEIFPSNSVEVEDVFVSMPGAFPEEESASSIHEPFVDELPLSVVAEPVEAPLPSLTSL